MSTNEAVLHRLMVRSLNGEADAYRMLLATCRTWLLRYYARRVASAQIHDLIQETLISLHTKRASFDIDRPFLPWLAAIARYRWIDALRRTTRTGEVELHDVIAADADEDALIATLSVARLLSQIKPEQAFVIQLVKIEGLSIAEASLRSGQSEALVKVNIHRGLKRMAALVESE